MPYHHKCKEDPNKKHVQEYRLTVVEGVDEDTGGMV